MADDEQRRLERFGRLQPPKFSSAELEDAQGFMDKFQRMLRTTGILETSGVLFTTFQFSGDAFRWWETYERSRPVGAMTLSWHEFSYEMRFSELDRHAVWLVPTEREKIRRFINGLNQQFYFIMTLGNIEGAGFDEVVDSARCLEMVRTQEREERLAQIGHLAHREVSAIHGSYSARQSRPFHGELPAQSSSRAPSVQGSSVPGSSGSYSGSRGPPQNLPPFFERDCYECAELGHVRK
ncbi:uncharacterized protein [Nicotiana tomentosiformis]|uniref:uncharacterized protein n=1 Tax=Nicotiana tomentosiformis TaxID=4098 RepID=UPI00388C4860